MTWLRTRSPPPLAARARSLRRYASHSERSSLPAVPVVFARSLSLLSSFSSSNFTKGSGRAGPWNVQSVRSNGTGRLRHEHQHAKGNDLGRAEVPHTVQQLDSLFMNSEDTLGFESRR